MDRENIFQIAQNALDGKYGEEDLLTDLFGVLLSLDHKAAKTWFKYLSGISSNQVSIKTQPAFRGYPHDAPDLLLEADEMVLVCEHKITSPLGDRQLERYLTLVKGEEERTGIPHRLALVARELLNIPPSILEDFHFHRPEHAPHFRWQDVPKVMEEVEKQSSDSSSLASQMRWQFIEHLRFLRLAAVSLPDGFVPVHSQNTPAEKEQQRAFGEQWLLARNWFIEKGYRCHLGSRVQLYILPTPYSEIPDQGYLRHMLVEPTLGKDLPRYAQFDPPVLEFNAIFEPGSEALATTLLAEKNFHLVSLDMPVSVQRLSMPGNRIRVSFALQLAPLFEAGNLMDALFAVVTEIYSQHVQPVFQGIENS